MPSNLCRFQNLMETTLQDIIPLSTLHLTKCMVAKTFWKFIDECHHRDIAVIMDIALNHSFGSNPQVRMYFDEDIGEWGQPSPDIPGSINSLDVILMSYDYNHESEKTKSSVKEYLSFGLKNIVLMDLTRSFKGFTK